MPVFAQNAVATSQPLAAQAGLSMIQRGGNAIDAALATAIALTVVEPTMNGIGSDAFAITWNGESLHGLNSSGCSPRAWTRERFDEFDQMPSFGWDSVTVPGSVAAWVALSERFGALPFEELFQPAIEYAERGFQVGPFTAALWARFAALFESFPGFQSTFVFEGRTPRPGELARLPDHARTLREIAETRGESFYRGDLAARIAAHAADTGGLLDLTDLAALEPEWVDPIAIDFAGHRLHEIPPNGQGLAALVALGVLERTPIAEAAVDSPDSLHLQIEAMKVGIAEAAAHIADPEHLRVDMTKMLSDSYLDSHARNVALDAAREHASALPSSPDTVYLTAADADGRMISYIQSNYFGFGSGIVVPGTGIALQNRAAGFTLERGHVNEVAGGKRPFHTIIPGFVTTGSEPTMSFGVMGGPMQPQGHLQIMVRIFLYGQNPQTAADGPRWQVMQNGTVAVEQGFAPETLEDLRARGHKLVIVTSGESMGGAQLIYRMPGGYCAASDPRKEGQAVGF